MTIKNSVINFFLLVALVGVIDAGYLTISHFQGTETGCFLVEGCNVVLQSKYAEIFNIPAALLGLIFYLVIFFGVLLFNFNHKIGLIKNMSILSIAGFLVTLWFVYLQIFVLKTFCSYCLVSAVTSTFLFLLGLYVLRILSKNLP